MERFHYMILVFRYIWLDVFSKTADKTHERRNVILKIAICDDELEITQQIEGMVRKCLPDCEVICYGCGADLLAAQETFDLIFLDIQMDGLNGIQTAKKIRSMDENVLIVFITGIKEYVFDAFDVTAFHYLLKPVQIEKLQEVLHKAERKITGEKHCKKRQLLIKTREKSLTIDTDDILFLENALRKIVIHTKTESILVYGTMSEFEQKVGSGFYRSHRGYLVNMAHIAEYDTENIYMDNGEIAYLTRKNYPDFVKQYMRFLRDGDVYHA